MHGRTLEKNGFRQLPRKAWFCIPVMEKALDHRPQGEPRQQTGSKVTISPQLELDGGRQGVRPISSMKQERRTKTQGKPFPGHWQAAYQWEVKRSGSKENQNCSEFSYLAIKTSRRTL